MSVFFCGGGCSLRWHQGLGLLHHLLQKLLHHVSQGLHLSLQVFGQGLDLRVEVVRQGPDVLLDVGDERLDLLLQLGGLSLDLLHQRLDPGPAVLHVGPTAKGQRKKSVKAAKKKHSPTKMAACALIFDSLGV